MISPLCYPVISDHANQKAATQDTLPRAYNPLLGAVTPKHGFKNGRYVTEYQWAGTVTVTNNRVMGNRACNSRYVTGISA